MTNRNYPIILGHRYNKGLIVMPDGSGIRLLICRLKKEYPTGARFEKEDIKNVELDIRFSDPETLETTVRVLTEALNIWRTQKDD